METTLDLVQVVADLTTAIPQLKDLASLEAHAAREGCRWNGPEADGTYTMICTSRLLNDEILGLVMHVTFLDDGVLVLDPALADQVRVGIVAGTNFMQCGGELDLVHDPDRGTILNGPLDTFYVIGCRLETVCHDLITRSIADVPGQAAGTTVFAQGNVDLDLSFEYRPAVNGTAALVGRRAVVLLNVDGVATTGEVSLD